MLHIHLSLGKAGIQYSKDQHEQIILNLNELQQNMMENIPGITVNAASAYNTPNVKRKSTVSSSSLNSPTMSDSAAGSTNYRPSPRLTRRLTAPQVIPL